VYVNTRQPSGYHEYLLAEGVELEVIFIKIVDIVGFVNFIRASII